MLRLRLLVFSILLVVSIVSEITAPSSDDECGGALSGDNGTITSPDYPDKYRDNARCVWTISGEPGKQIQLIFHEFRVEYHPDCDSDWVLIYDNSTSRINPLRKKCGCEILEIIWSNGNQMFVEFESDRSVGYSGFRASWVAESKVLPVCGGALSGDNGTITSPTYPDKYWREARCMWNISVEPGEVIRLTFHQFAVEGYYLCFFDWVLIYDNLTSRANPLGKKCGLSIPEPIRSNGNQMFVEFKSDRFSKYSGFRASWAAACPPGTFGNNCKDVCSSFCGGKDQECDKVNGKCLFGCVPGLTGDFCNTSCPPGTFGDNCKDVCSVFCGGEDQACDPVNGKCLSGCVPGYSGDFCNINLSPIYLAFMSG